MAEKLDTGGVWTTDIFMVTNLNRGFDFGLNTCLVSPAANQRMEPFVADPHDWLWKNLIWQSYLNMSSRNLLRRPGSGVSCPWCQTYCCSSGSWWCPRWVSSRRAPPGQQPTGQCWRPGRWTPPTQSPRGKSSSPAAAGRRSEFLADCGPEVKRDFSQRSH